MEYNRPTLFIITGPPGAGKSTFGETLMPKALEGLELFKREQTADAILSALTKEIPDLSDAEDVAYAMMQKSMDQSVADAIAEYQNFAIEMPLSLTRHIDILGQFLKSGYQVQLAYLCLDKLEDCITRVQHRASTGGLYVDPETINDVYHQNLKVVDIFVPAFVRIDLYDGMGTPKLLASLENNKLTYIHPEAKTKQWITEGLPDIGKQIKQTLPPIKKHKGMRF